MLTTLLEPTAGTATVAGYDLVADPVGVRRSIGYVSQSGSTLPEARAGEEVVDHARLYGMSTAEATARGQRAVRASSTSTGLWERKPKAMSGGQRRRLDIADGPGPRAGAGVPRRADHRPRPAGPGQPLGAHRGPARRSAATTVFLTTHYLDEADALCDRILVIDHGAIVAEGTPDELKSQVSAATSSPSTVAEPAQVAGRSPGWSARCPAPTSPQVRRTTGSCGRVPHGGRGAGRPAPRARPRPASRWPASRCRRPSLDDVFLTLTGRSLRDAEPRAEPTTEEPRDGVTVPLP